MDSMKVSDFDLKSTLESGQLFRFWLHDGGYVIGQRENLLFVRQNQNVLEFEGCDSVFLRHFLGLDDPIESMLASFESHPAIVQAVRSYPGIRLLRQDPFECLVGFLCSSASNIPKIKRNMNGMAKSFGKPVAIRGFSTYSFPAPKQLTNLQAISAASTGYRAKYIHETTNQIDDDWLEALRHLPYQEAKAQLMTLPGIGSKIADCVLLFSLGFSQAFPVDVWIEKAMHELYPYSKRLSQSRLESYGRKKFGPYAGYAQQYLYHWRRTGNSVLGSR